MVRKILVLSTTLITATLTFAVTSFATSEDTTPRLRDNLPVRGIPAESLAESEAVRINNLLGDLGSAVEITWSPTPSRVAWVPRLATRSISSPVRVASASCFAHPQLVVTRAHPGVA